MFAQWFDPWLTRCTKIRSKRRGASEAGISRIAADPGPNPVIGDIDRGIARGGG